jgi:GH15 family glucan-1,4-alpha-glucosidase
VFALVRAGFVTEARGFTGWIVRRCEDALAPGELQSLYGIDGRRTITESTLDHLEGYRGSRPVRIGNAAYDQLQLDVYGELMDALYLGATRAQPLPALAWQRVIELTNWVAQNWRRPDQGIWEVRTGAQEFLFSRVMCWVALDRALRIADRRHAAAPHDEWRRARDEIRGEIEEQFWNEAIGAFVGSRGSATVDAACLVMPLVRFIGPRDPRWLSTLRVVEERLVRDWLVRRYDMGGMDTDAGEDTAPAFTILSFWYIECLARAGRADEAREGMRQLLAYANQLGLFAEDIAADGRQVGNFPQGLVHAGLIGAAVGIAEADRG